MKDFPADLGKEFGDSLGLAYLAGYRDGLEIARMIVVHPEQIKALSGLLQDVQAKIDKLANAS